MQGVLRFTVFLILLAGLSTTSALTRDRLRIQLEARPSPLCFPASALQLPELREDFTKICTDCDLIPASQGETDFRIVVEDPGFKWVLKIYDRDNDLVKQLKWTGSLQSGLREAVGFIHSHPSPDKVSLRFPPR